MKQVTDTSKAILWWNDLTALERDEAMDKCGIDKRIRATRLTYDEIKDIYLSEHPQPTDTGNTVSSEVGFTGGEWNMYISEKGKDGCSRAYINSALPNDMYETICTMAGLNGTEPGEQAKANAQRIVQAVNNHDALVSALKDAMDQIRQLSCDYAGYSGNENHPSYYGKISSCAKAKELLNNISNK